MLSIAEFALIRTQGGVLLIGYEGVPGFNPNSVGDMLIRKLDDGLYELTDHEHALVRFSPLTSRDVLKISTAQSTYLAPLDDGAFNDAFSVRIQGVAK